MRVRDSETKDFEELESLYRKQGFGYDLPDFSGFVAAKVLVDENDRIQMAVGARPTVELFMLANPEWANPYFRFEAFKLIHLEMHRKLAEQGVEDVHVWLPPEISKSFGRRLLKYFGWSKQLWPSYSRKV